MSNQPPPGSNSPAQERVPRIPPDRYALLGILGSGGMGTVLKARHAQLNKLVAIKVLNMELLKDKSSLVRFETEAKAGGQLSHPNLIAVFDFGYTVDGEPFFVMEYVEGASLGDLVKRHGRCSNDDFVQIFSQALKALNYIHRKGVIHRDIKSSNIMLQVIEGDRYVKLLDFGIAKVLAESGVTMQQLTATGEAIGSPLYMSPEQCRGSNLDSRADIYSLGCVMHECFAGYPPFKGENAFQTMDMHMNNPPAPLAAKCRSEQELQIASLIHKCILKDPNERFQTAAELLESLDEIANVNRQVASINRPPAQPAGGMGNRWKKGGASKSASPQEANNENAMESIKASGLHQALKPGPKGLGATGLGGGGLGATGIGQTLRRPTQETQVGGLGGGNPNQQNTQMGGTLVTGLGGNAGQPNQNTQNIAQESQGLSPEAMDSRWHMHNVAGQQQMASRNNYEAERHFMQAIEIAEKFDMNDPRLAKTLNSFANCLKVQGRYEESEEAYKRALQIRENSVGPVHKDLVLYLENYANLLRVCSREQDAAKIDKRIQGILKL